MPEQSARTIFNNALDLADPNQRANYLAQACGSDEALRGRVEKLLRAHDDAGGFLGEPENPPAAKGTIILSLTEKPGDKIGHYKLLQQIGEGGCGVVYMAEQEEPVRRKVALKVIKLGMDTKQVVARFEAERQVLALMDHPNIAKVLDAGATESGRPYFVMELVRGVKITEFCDQQKLSTHERLELFMQVCSAIQHAHQKGIIHRDLKPSNILVTTIDGVAMPKVIDFGIAKATNNQRLTDKTLFTAFEQFIGTPAYMSPEQAEMSGVDIDTRSDIYSLGVVLYELLTGKTPFAMEELLKSGLEEIRRTIREHEPPKPSTRLNTLLAEEATTVEKARQSPLPALVKLVSGDLDWIALKCLEKDRNRRYETANALVLDLQRHLQNEPVAARPPSHAYRIQKFVRRNKGVFTAGVVVLLVLVGGIVASTWQAIRARRAEHEAKLNARLAQAEATTTKKVAGFLQDMLKQAGPSVALGRDTTILREILEQTAARLHADFNNEPRVEAELSHTLGQVYLELADFKKADPLIRRALELRKKLNDDRLVADTTILLAELTFRKGAVTKDKSLGNSLAEAEKLSREALEMSKRLGGNTKTTGDALLWHAIFLTRGGKLVEAEPLHRQAIEMRRKLFGVEHSDIAEALAELAYNQHLQGKLVESENLYRESLAMQRKLFGKEHPSIGVTLVSLGYLLQQQNKLTEAEAMYRECLAMQRKLLGNQHPQLLTVTIALMNLLDQQGKTNEAASLRAEAQMIGKKTLNNEVVFRAFEKVSKGRSRFNEGKPDEAEPLLREGWEALRKESGADNPETISALGWLGQALAARKQWVEAESAHREALATWQKIGKGDEIPGASARYDLAMTLQQRGKLPEAETTLREAMAISKKHLGDSASPMRSVVSKELARVLVKEGKSAEAESLALELVTILKQSRPNPANTIDPLYDMANMFYEEGKLHEAERLFGEVIALRRPEGTQTDIAVALSGLARALQSQGKFAEAEIPYRECLAIREKQVPDAWYTFYTKSMLGHTLLKQKKYAEAEAMLVSGYQGMKEREDKIPDGAKKYIKETVHHLVALYEATERPDKAAEWKKIFAEFDKPETEKKATTPKP